MAISNTAVFGQTPKISLQSFVNADGVAKKTVVTAGVNGTKVLSGTIASTDTATRDMRLWVTRSAVSYLIGTLHIAITAGSDGVTNGVNAFNLTLIPGLPLDQFGHPFIYLQSGDTLQASMIVAVTAALEIDITLNSVDF